MLSQTTKNQIFSNINFYLLLFLACGPVLFMLLSMITKTSIDTIFYVWGILFVIFYAIYFVLNLKDIKVKKIKDKLLLTLAIFLIVGLTFVLISSFVKRMSISALQMFLYALLFFSVLMLKKEQSKIFLFILISNFALACLFGIMDPTNYCIPGFNPDCVDSSLFFFHANYSQAIAAILIIILYHLMIKEKNKILATVYVFYFVIIGLWMFLNSSSVGITAVFLIMLANIVIDWIRTKKFPIKVFLVFLAYIGFAFLIELYPNIYNLRTAHYNYFIEVIDVFDNIFGTNLTKTWFGIESVPGSNGWERGSLLWGAIAAVWGNGSMGFGERLINNLFGLGGGSLSELRPHNMFVGGWVDFGIVFAICHYAIIILGLVFLIKNIKHAAEDIVPYIYAIIAYLFVTMFLPRFASPAKHLFEIS